MLLLGVCVWIEDDNTMPGCYWHQTARDKLTWCMAHQHTAPLLSAPPSHRAMESKHWLRQESWPPTWRGSFISSWNITVLKFTFSPLCLNICWRTLVLSSYLSECWMLNNNAMIVCWQWGKKRINWRKTNNSSSRVVNEGVKTTLEQPH